MAPEQFSGEEVDARADVYALGCVLYNALTGEVPYPRGTVPATMLAHLHDEPPRPTRGRRGRAAGFDRVIARALAKDPEAPLPVGRRPRPRRARRRRRPARDRDASGRSRAAPPPRRTRAVNGHTAVTVVAAPTQARPQAAAPPPRARADGATSRARRCRSATARAARCAAAPGAAARRAARDRRRRPRRSPCWATAGDAVDPQTLPGAHRRPRARSSRSCRTSRRRTPRRTPRRSAGC